MMRRTIFGKQYAELIFPNAKVVLSLRDCTGTNPAVVRIRRSNDNAENDFTASDLDNGNATSFVGSGNTGYVAKWYDQSGNSNHATQSTAGNQPQIISSSGIIEKIDSINSVYFTGSRGLMFTNVTIDYKSIFIYAKRQTVNIANYAVANTTPVTFGLFFGGSAVSGIGVTNGSTLIQSTVNDLNKHYATFLNDNTNTKIYVDGIYRNQGTAYNLRIRSVSIPGQAGSSMEGRIQEIVMYDTDQTSNRTTIETKLNR